MSNNQRRVPFGNADDQLFVQCYDYEDEDPEDTFFYVWNGKRYQKLQRFDSQNGTVYIPNKIGRAPRDGTPIVKMASKPKEYGSFKDLVADIREFIHKYGDISELEEKYCAYYVIFTWVYDKSTVCPYLRFIGDAGKGKTRLLKTVGSICFFPKLTGVSTKSAAIRSHSKWLGTSLFNEADGLAGDEKDDFTRWINNGFEKGNPIEMSVPDNPQEQERFDTFGPKLFAAKKPFDDPATESRVISIEMKETDRDDIPLFLPPEFHDEALELRNKLLHFRFQNYQEIDPISEPEVIKQLDIESRIKQTSLPLYPIIKQHGDEAVEEFMDYLVQRQEDVTKQRSQSKEGLVFNKLYDIATGEHPGKFERYRPDGDLIGITASMVADELGKRWSEQKVGRIIRELGFESESKNVELEKQGTNVIGEPDTERVTQRLIRVPNQKRWKEAVSRYLIGQETQNQVPDCLKGEGFIEGETEKN
jgi:hypothetical protein